PAVRRVRPRPPDRHRRRDAKPAGRLVQGGADARAVCGRRLAGVPRPAGRLRPVPPPPLREVGSGRLLGPSRLLRQRRPQAAADRPRRTPGAATTAPPQLVYTKAAGTVVNKRTGRPAPIQPLGGAPLTVGPEDDPRARLADWMTDPANSFFARAVVNRYWAHFFGRGLVDPLDDLRVTNPPSNPELLDALARESIAKRYSLKALVRTICTSLTYQLSAEPNEWNRHDKQNYARFYPKRMTAEVLLDAVSQVTDSPTAF